MTNTSGRETTTPPSQWLVTILTTLNLDPLEHGLQILDAKVFVPTHYGRKFAIQPSDTSTDPRAWAETQGVGTYTPPLLPFPLVPTQPALLCRITNNEVAKQVQAALLLRYPDRHAVVLIEDTINKQITRDMSLAQVTEHTYTHNTSLYLPPLEPLDDLHGAEGPMFVAARLLGPHGCPWDREQTHHSLQSELLEEAHEVLETITNNDMDALAEELGDLLLAVLMHSEMARQAGNFHINDVYHHIASKLIRRHPHVFGSTNVDGTDDVLTNWEAIKQAERAAKGQTTRQTLDGIPISLPALAMAQEISRKAAKVGFEWLDIQDVWNKVSEELAEVHEVMATTHHDDPAYRQRTEEELGDLLFATVVLARWLQVDAESALRAANAKFCRRFTYVEQHRPHQDWALISIDELIQLWDQAKTYDQ